MADIIELHPKKPPMDEPPIAEGSPPNALETKLADIYEVMKFQAVKEAIDELNHLRRLNQQYFDAITRSTQMEARIKKAAHAAIKSLDSMNLPEARKLLYRAMSDRHP